MASKSSSSSPSSSSTLHPTETLPQITCVPSLLNARNFFLSSLPTKIAFNGRLNLFQISKVKTFSILLMAPTHVYAPSVGDIIQSINERTRLTQKTNRRGTISFSLNNICPSHYCC